MALRTVRGYHDPGAGGPGMFLDSPSQAFALPFRLDLNLLYSD